VIDVTRVLSTFLCHILSGVRGVTQGKWDVPLPKVRGVSEAEVFKVVKTGKSRRTFVCNLCISLLADID